MGCVPMKCHKDSKAAGFRANPAAFTVRRPVISGYHLPAKKFLAGASRWRDAPYGRDVIRQLRTKAGRVPNIFAIARRATDPPFAFRP